MNQNFIGHYDEWRTKRINKIISFYGREFFRNKTLLEVGCGYGEIGACFFKLGALVTCSDARAEHLLVLKERYPKIQTIYADLDNEWPFRKKFDIVIHMGVLYHLKNIDYSLKNSCNAAQYLILETEVCDSFDPYMKISMVEEGYDQAFNGVGFRPSPRYVERVLSENSMMYIRSNDNLNASIHGYDWPLLGSGAWRMGERRFWFCYKK